MVRVVWLPDNRSGRAFYELFRETKSEGKAMSDWKQEVLKGAMKAMSNPTVQKIVSNEKTQKAFASAFKASYQLKTQIDDTKANVAKRMNLATSDDLRSMKRELDRLQRQVERLKREKQELEKNQ